VDKYERPAPAPLRPPSPSNYQGVPGAGGYHVVGLPLTPQPDQRQAYLANQRAIGASMPLLLWQQQQQLQQQLHQQQQHFHQQQQQSLQGLHQGSSNPDSNMSTGSSHSEKDVNDMLSGGATPGAQQQRQQQQQQQPLPTTHNRLRQQSATQRCAHV